MIELGRTSVVCKDKMVREQNVNEVDFESIRTITGRHYIEYILHLQYIRR